MRDPDPGSPPECRIDTALMVSSGPSLNTSRCKVKAEIDQGCTDDVHQVYVMQPGTSGKQGKQNIMVEIA